MRRFEYFVFHSNQLICSHSIVSMLSMKSISLQTSLQISLQNVAAPSPSKKRDHKCVECVRSSFTTAEKLAKHKKQFHSFKCRSCDKGFKSDQQRAEHEKKHEPEGKCPHVFVKGGTCSQCGEDMVFLKRFSAVHEKLMIHAFIFALLLCCQL